MDDQYKAEQKVRDAIKAKREAEESLALARSDHEVIVETEEEIRKEGGQEAVDKYYRDERRSEFYETCMTLLKIIAFCLAFYFLLVHDY